MTSPPARLLSNANTVSAISAAALSRKHATAAHQKMHEVFSSCVRDRNAAEASLNATCNSRKKNVRCDRVSHTRSKRRRPTDASPCSSTSAVRERSSPPDELETVAYYAAFLPPLRLIAPRTLTRQPRGPGIAPATSTRLSPGTSFATRWFNTLTVSLP